MNSTKIFRSIFLVSVAFLLSTTVFSQVVMVTGFKNASYSEMANDLDKFSRKVVIYDTNYISEEEFKVVKTEYPLINIKTTSGSYFNGRRLVGNFNKKEKEVFFVQEDVLKFLKEQSSKEENFDCTENVRILAPLGKEEIHLVTRANSRINSIEDLKSRTVSIGSVNQGTNITATTIKKLTGIKFNDVNMSFNQAKKKLLESNIDAFFFVGSAPVKDIAEAGKGDGLKLVPIRHPELDKYFTKSHIFADSYDWLTEDIETYSVRVLLATNIETETPEETHSVKLLLESIRDNISKLQDKGHRGWKVVSFEFKDMDEWIIHDEAMKVFDLIEQQ